MTSDYFGWVSSYGIWWCWNSLNNDGLNIYPSKSLLQNIGHDDSGTHSGLTDKYRVNMDNEWRMIDLSKHKVVISNSNEIQHEGVGSNVLGDPRVALTWLVNELSQNNISLDKGMIVSTGTCAKPIPIKVGDTVRADYGQLGSISVILK